MLFSFRKSFAVDVFEDAGIVIVVEVERELQEVVMKKEEEEDELVVAVVGQEVVELLKLAAEEVIDGIISRSAFVDATTSTLPRGLLAY